MSLVRKLVGASSETAPAESPADTIERLCDRLQTAKSMEDRIGAVRSLKSLSRDYRLEVGTNALHLLVDILQNEQGSSELLILALETLLSLFDSHLREEDEEDEEAPGESQDSRSDRSASDASSNVSDEQERYKRGRKGSSARKARQRVARKNKRAKMRNARIADQHLGVQFAEIFASKVDNVRALVEILEQFDFAVRLGGVRVLNALLRSATQLVQEAVLGFVAGVTRVLDLLADSREVVRYETVVALRMLAAGNAAIQKILAFDNAFETVLDMLADERYSDGGLVVRNYIELLLSLLRGNAHNQHFFVESGFMERLVPFFEQQTAEEDEEEEDDEQSHSSEWSDEKRDNMLIMLSIVRAFVAFSNSPKATRAAQQAMERAGLLRVLCELLVRDGVPSDVLVDCVLTIAELVRGCSSSQQLLASLCISPDGAMQAHPLDSTATGSISGSGDSRSLLIVLLMNVVSSEQPFALRAAATFAFESALLRNGTLQHAILDELLPRNFAGPQLTAGTLLLSGVLANDSAQRRMLASSLTGWLCGVALSYVISDDPTAKESLLLVQIVLPDKAEARKPVSVSFFAQCCSVLVDARTSPLRRLGVLQLLAAWLCDSTAGAVAFLRERDAVQFCLEQALAADSPAEENDAVIRGACGLLLGLCVLFNDDSVPEYSSRQLQTTIERRIGVETFLDRLGAVTRLQLFVRASQQPTIVALREADVCLDYQFTVLFKQMEPKLRSTLLRNSAEQQNSVSSRAAVHKEVEQKVAVSPTKDKQHVANDSQQEIERLRQQLASAREDLDAAHSRIDVLERNANESVPTQNGNASDELVREKQQLEEQLRSYAYYYTQSQNTVQLLQTELDSCKAQLTACQTPSETLTAEKQSIGTTCHNELPETVEVAVQTVQLDEEAEKKCSELQEQNTSLNDELARQQQDLEDLLVLLADQELKLNAYAARFGEIELDDAEFPATNIADEITEKDAVDEVNQDVDTHREDQQTSNESDTPNGNVGENEHCSAEEEAIVPAHPTKIEAENNAINATQTERDSDDVHPEVALPNVADLSVITSEEWQDDSAKLDTEAGDGANVEMESSGVLYGGFNDEESGFNRFGEHLETSEFEQPQWPQPQQEQEQEQEQGQEPQQQQQQPEEEQPVKKEQEQWDFGDNWSDVEREDRLQETEFAPESQQYQHQQQQLPQEQQQEEQTESGFQLDTQNQEQFALEQQPLQQQQQQQQQQQYEYSAANVPQVEATSNAYYADYSSYYYAQQQQQQQQQQYPVQENAYQQNNYYYYSQPQSSQNQTQDSYNTNPQTYTNTNSAYAYYANANGQYAAPPAANWNTDASSFG